MTKIKIGACVGMTGCLSSSRNTTAASDTKNNIFVHPLDLFTSSYISVYLQERAVPYSLSTIFSLSTVGDFYFVSYIAHITNQNSKTMKM
jgi:hypothetical protein